MKKTSGILLVFLLVIFLGNGNPRYANAATEILIRSDGSVEGTDRIEREGNTYTLTDDLNDPIVVEKDCITIDGAGYAIQGNEALNSTGITLSKRSNVTIKNTKVEAFSIGIDLWNSVNNTIYANNVTSNDIGLRLDYLSNNNSIYGNCIKENDSIGIYVFNSSNNAIIKNIIENNARYGLILIYSANNNTIYHNQFINNTVQVYAFDSADIWDQTQPPDSTNIWNSNYPSGGNYWSDYTYIDSYSGSYQNLTGSDGIWDYPYVIDPLNQDEYPIIPEFPTWTILLVFVFVVFFVATIKKEAMSRIQKGIPLRSISHQSKTA